MEQLDEALGDVDRVSTNAMDTWRLNVPRWTISLVIAPVLKAFMPLRPDIKIDVVTDSSLVDIAGKGYDTGIRYDHVVAQHMIAIPIVADMRFCVVASPEYLDGKTLAAHPRDLLKRDCISYRSADPERRSISTTAIRAACLASCAFSSTACGND
jgi:DNA-binding transcriptional LysR family regulator